MNKQPASSFAIASGALAILFCGLAAPAHAGEIAVREHRVRFYEEEPRKQTVRFGDLDLSRLEGRRVLESRLKRAARNVCSMDNMLPFSELRRQERECEVQTLSVAMAEVAPTLMLASSR